MAMEHENIDLVRDMHDLNLRQNIESGRENEMHTSINCLV